MSENGITRKKLEGGLTRLSSPLNQDKVHSNVKEVVGFIQTICDSNPLMALAVAQVTLDSLKRLFDVRSEVILSENPLQ